MKNIKLDVNTVNQGISLFLWVFVLAGLKIDPNTTSTQLIDSIQSKNWAFLGMLIFNTGAVAFHWIKTWQNDKPNFGAFLRSNNWWLSFANIAASLLLLVGVNLPPETSDQIVGAIFQKDWWALATLAFTNLLLPIIRRFVEQRNFVIPRNSERI
jgi:uncharacterized membrane protein